MASIDSPCVKLCHVDRKTGVCTGCGRTLDEIAAWPTLPGEERRAIMDRLEKARMALKEGG